MKIVEYKQGETKVWCDGEKIIIKNPTGAKHVEANIDQIFGMGEFKKIHLVKYTEEYDKKKFRAPYELTSGYIPVRAQKDLKDKGYPGLKEKDYGKLFS